MDKHHLIIPTTNYGNIDGLKLKDKGVQHKVNTWGQELEKEFQIAVGADVEVEDNGNATFEITFKRGPAENMEVVDYLRVCSGTVVKVVEILEQFPK